MNSKQVQFSDRPIAITLTGERWFALMAKLAGKPLSEQGEAAYQAALAEIVAVARTQAEL
jgi:hypothetical protein